METQDEFKKTESMRVWAFQDGKLEMDHMDVPVFDHEQECFTGAGECDVPPYLVVMGYGAIALIGEEFYDACEATVFAYGHGNMPTRKYETKIIHPFEEPPALPAGVSYRFLILLTYGWEVGYEILAARSYAEYIGLLRYIQPILTLQTPQNKESLRSDNATGYWRHKALESGSTFYDEDGLERNISHARHIVRERYKARSPKS